MDELRGSVAAAAAHAHATLLSAVAGAPAAARGSRFGSDDDDGDDRAGDEEQELDNNDGTDDTDANDEAERRSDRRAPPQPPCAAPSSYAARDRALSVAPWSWARCLRALGAPRRWWNGGREAEGSRARARTAPMTRAGARHARAAREMVCDRVYLRFGGRSDVAACKDRLGDEMEDDEGLGTLSLAALVARRAGAEGAGGSALRYASISMSVGLDEDEQCAQSGQRIAIMHNGNGGGVTPANFARLAARLALTRGYGSLVPHDLRFMWWAAG